MIDDQIHRSERVDLLRVPVQRLHGIAHRGQVHNRGNSSEILHQHARRAVGNLAVRGALLEPACDREDVVLGDGAAILMAQQIFQKDFQRVRKPRNACQTPPLGRLEAEISVGLATDGECAAALETVEASQGPSSFGVDGESRREFSSIYHAMPRQKLLDELSRTPVLPAWRGSALPPEPKRVLFRTRLRNQRRVNLSAIFPSVFWPCSMVYLPT